jgi:hypothetical protein
MDAYKRDLQVSRRGRVPTWFALLLGAGALFAGVELLDERQSAEGYSRVDTARAKILCDESEPCAPGEWSELVAARLAELGPLDANDPEAVEGVKDVLDGLSIFRSVSAPRVLWPDGIEVDVRLRRAAACVQSEGGFRSISRDGVVLPGFSVSQPLDELGLLPLIAMGEEVQHLMEGDLLPRDEDFDALSVAVSMQDHLSADHRASMGEILIERSPSGSTTGRDPEISLKIQNSRGVLFGRPPIAGHPGELPEEKKWGHLAEYLSDYPTSDRDWAVLDVRWDVPEVMWKK